MIKCSDWFSYKMKLSVHSLRSAVNLIPINFGVWQFIHPASFSTIIEINFASFNNLAVAALSCLVFYLISDQYPTWVVALADSKPLLQSLAPCTSCSTLGFSLSDQIFVSLTNYFVMSLRFLILLDFWFASPVNLFFPQLFYIFPDSGAATRLTHWTIHDWQEQMLR